MTTDEHAAIKSSLNSATKAFNKGIPSSLGCVVLLLLFTGIPLFSQATLYDLCGFSDYYDTHGNQLNTFILVGIICTLVLLLLLSKWILKAVSNRVMAFNRDYIKQNGGCRDFIDIARDSEEFQSVYKQVEDSGSFTKIIGRLFTHHVESAKMTEAQRLEYLLNHSDRVLKAKGILIKLNRYRNYEKLCYPATIIVFLLVSTLLGYITRDTSVITSIYADLFTYPFTIIMIIMIMNLGELPFLARNASLAECLMKSLDNE